MRTTVTPQAGGTVPFDRDRYKCLMIRKRVCEAVRKTGKQLVYEADDRAQASATPSTSRRRSTSTAEGSICTHANPGRADKIFLTAAAGEGHWSGTLRGARRDWGGANERCGQSHWLLSKGEGTHGEPFLLHLVSMELWCGVQEKAQRFRYHLKGSG